MWPVQLERHDLEVDQLGSKLSVKIGCAVHYPAYGKHIFECEHGVCFPLFVVASEDWEYITHKHSTESKFSH